MRVIILCFFYLAATALYSQGQLPIKTETFELKSLRTLVDKSLQKDIENELFKNPKWKSLINQKKMAVGIVDLRNTKQLILIS